MFNHSFKNLAMKNRETCHHWIDYEIYESLSDALKEKYLNSFNEHKICWTPPCLDKSSKINVKCKSNDKDRISEYFHECTECYTKTCDQLLKHLQEQGLVNMEIE